MTFFRRFLAAFIALCAARHCTFAQVETVTKSCSKATTSTQSVIRGWPTSFTCYSLLEYSIDELFGSGEPPFALTCLVYLNDSLVHQNNFTFVISENGEDVVGEEAYVLSSVEESQTYQLVLVSGSVCSTGDLQLTALDPSSSYEFNTECSTFAAEATRVGDVVKTPFSCDENNLHLDCIVGDDELAFERFNFNYDVTWFRDCVEMTSQQYSRLANDEVGNVVSKIKLTGEYSTYAGSYSCMVKYNNQTRFIRHQTVCVSEPEPIKQNLIAPNSHTVDVTLGDDVTLECSGSGALGQKFSKRFAWNKTDTICKINQKIGGSMESYEKYTCMENSSARAALQVCDETPRCAEFNTSSGERFTISLLIRNVSESDLGEYDCIVTNQISQASGRLLLVEKQVPPPSTALELVIAAVAGVVLLLVCGFLVARCFWIDILLLRKKWRKSYCKEKRNYAAFLTYSFGRDDASSDDTKEFLHSLHNWFDDKCYRVYDEHCRVAGGFRCGEVKRAVAESHRTVIVVTPNFLKSDEKIFDTHSGILSAVEEGTRLIFLVTPSARNLMQKEAESKQETLVSLKMAMRQKRNSVIYWQGMSRKTRFFKKLDVAMPKLRPESYTIKNPSAFSDKSKHHSEVPYQGPVKTVSVSNIV